MNTFDKRACLAAEAWKRLYPEGAEKSGRPKKGEISNGKIAVTFETFAKVNFKAGERYAKQAQAILNHSP